MLSAEIIKFDVGCSYGFLEGREIVPFRPVSIALRERKPLLIVGENGSGKTTLLRAIIGAEPNAFGEMELSSAQGSGGDIVALGDFSALGLTCRYLPQNPRNGIPRDVVVGTALKIAGVLAREKVQDPSKGGLEACCGRKLANIVWDLRDRHVSKLSGGESQILALVLALLARPDLLVLDEPTAALSGSRRAAVASLLWGDLHDSDLSLDVRPRWLMLSSHDQVLVDSLDGAIVRLA